MEWLNSLFNGLKEPVVRKQVETVLADMDYPHFSQLLTYDLYDHENDLFVNDKTVGFVIRITPLSGANETIADTLHNLLYTKLPKGEVITFHLVSNHKIGGLIDQGLSDFNWKCKDAEQSKFFNSITSAYYKKAVTDGFSSPSKLPLTLRDYTGYVVYAEKQGDRTTQTSKLTNLRQIIMASLDTAKLQPAIVKKTEFMRLAYRLVNPKLDSVYDDELVQDEYQEISKLIVNNGFEMNVSPDDIEINISTRTKKSSTKILNFQLASCPVQATLWGTPNHIANLLSPDIAVTAPFVVTLAVKIDDLMSSQTEATRKFLNIEKNSQNKLYCMLSGNINQKLNDWKTIRDELNDGTMAMCQFYYNITVFCPNDKDTFLKTENQVLNAYRKIGMTMIAPTYMQLRNYLSCLPFMTQEGLFDDLKKTGAVLRAKSSNVTQLFPIVSDNRIGYKGLLAPSYRHQTAFLDIFGEGDNTNYNMAVCGTSGAGKTGFVQPILRSVLDSGGKCWVFDMGDGYKSFCQNVSGTYIDASTLKFNPFANVTNITEMGERIRDQLSVLASPNGSLDDVHEAILLEAVLAAWNTKKNNARIDDVVDYLERFKVEQHADRVSAIHGRIDEMILLLTKYTTNGIYGEYFNSSEPSLRDDLDMIVLELGSLDKTPDLLVAVMFSLILFIESRMYQSDRRIKKVCAIDEGWRLLNFKNKKVGAFIETGYRTARRFFGAFITISQNIGDFDSPDASSAAQAAWANSSLKLIAKQDAMEFKKYCDINDRQFSSLEQEIVRKFGNARVNHFSSFMLRIGDNTSFHRLFLDPLSRAMFSSNGRDFEFLQTARAEGRDLHDAIYELACHNFPDEMRALEKMINEEHLNEVV